MFRRKEKDGQGRAANQLRDEATPNVLNWTATDSADSTESEFESDEEFENEAEEEDPEAAARRAAELQAELERQAEEYGLTSDDPRALYGPDGEEVAALLDALDDIDARKAERLADAWAAVDPAEREVVERVLRRNHRGGKHEYELSAAEDAVGAWLAAQTPADDEEEGLWREVAHAAADAVTAIILDEDLSDADYDTLYGPWAEVMDAEGEDADGDEIDAAETTEESGSEEAVPADADAKDEGEFGPNTALVVELLTRLDAIEAVQTAELVARWRDQPKDELKAAHRSMQELADEDAAWREQLRLAQEEVFAWMDHRTTNYLERSAAIDKTRIRESAGPVVADAIAALVLADILEPEDAELLYAPWADVVGGPDLPEYDDNGTA